MDKYYRPAWLGHCAPFLPAISQRRHLTSSSTPSATTVNSDTGSIRRHMRPRPPLVRLRPNQTIFRLSPSSRVAPPRTLVPMDSHPNEENDVYCLDADEAGALLAGAPWRRLL